MEVPELRPGDCRSPDRLPLLPPIREPHEHAWALVDWIEHYFNSVGYGDRSEKEGSIRTWLALAAGLKSVDIDMSAQDGSSMYCSVMQAHGDAWSDTVTAWQTELTRLLYVYSALETIVHEFDPRRSSNGPVLPVARRILATSHISPLLHADIVVDHLKYHVLSDSDLRANLKMMGAFAVPGGLGEEVLPLQAGIQFRHLLAHGALQIPEPLSEGDEEKWRPGGQSEVCMVKEASTCLLLSIQMLFMHGVSAGIIDFYNGEKEFIDGLWLPPDGWIFELSAKDYLPVLHLTETEGPDDPPDPPWLHLAQGK